MKKKFDDYYLGLDIGTSSIGWAVTDQKYNVLRFNGKSMWGVRLFDEANTAKVRRLHRSERRRNDRKKQRINLLQELFAKPIAEVDDKFFLRLKESKFWIDDKYESGHKKYTLFNDENYTDSDFYNDYPTIYHLRKALIDGDEKALKDIRFVYLACHNIIKNRGHFLFSGELVSFFDDIDSEIMELSQIIEDEYGFSLQCEDIDNLKSILRDKNQTITGKKKQVEKLFNFNKFDKSIEKQQKAIISLLAGSKTSLKDALNIDSEDDVKLQLSSGDFDENVTVYEEFCGEKIYLLKKVKAIYDWGILAQILDGEQYLSYAKVNSYEKHKYDLNLLKKVIKNNLSNEYNNIFRDVNEKDNYCAYVGNGLNKCSKDDFYKRIKKSLKKVQKSEYVEYILEEIDKETFLPKQITKDNGVVPNQVHKNELIKILDNASLNWDFLNDRDEYGTIKDKIIDILTFRIPYYVGPLNTNNSEAGFSWAVKKTNEKIYPWNYREVIDEEKSAEEFIKRMTNKCVYLPWADVLPKNSIYYQGYMVLNELNNLRINEMKLPIRAKQDLFENLFKNQKKVTNNQILGFLKRTGYLENKPNDEYKISGIDGAFKSSLSTYYTLSTLFKNNHNVTIDIMEQIVFYATIFGDEKEMFVNRIVNCYGNIISEKEVKQLKGLNFTGWGRFSKDFLLNITDVNKETGEYECILKALYNRQCNLQQLLSNEYKFTKKLVELNKSKLEVLDKSINYEDIENLYVSPAIRRAIWQTISIIGEIKSITGKEPKKIFIEMARGSEEKKRTESRYKKLENIYSKMKIDIQKWEREEVIEALKSKSDEELRSKKLYLWFTQLGKCMYTGATIHLEDLLYNNDKYDIDHIYPQSKVEDDSMDNKVLVLKNANAKKGDNYPLLSSIREKQYSFWYMLKNNGLIEEEKFKRLTRNTTLTEAELSSFVSRQLVETRQSTKAIGKLLEEAFESKIVYVKARNITKFRHGVDDTVYGYINKTEEEKAKIKKIIDDRKQKNIFIKCRSINDFHHAKDAYLAIVVGNVYDTKYTSNPWNYIKSKIQEGKFDNHSINAIYKFKVERNGEVAWLPHEKDANGTMETVRKQMNKNDILFTRYAYEKKHGQNGGFYDQNIVKADKGLQPIKGSDSRLQNTERYGGYKTVTPTYFVLVEYKDKKDRSVKFFETLPLYLKKKYEENEEFKQKVLNNWAKLRKCREPKILIDKIKYNSLINVNGFKMHLTGSNENQILFWNANQLILDNKFVSYIKKLENFQKKYDNNSNMKISVYDGISKEKNIILYDEFIIKLNNSIYKEKYSSQIENLNNLKNNFENLLVEEQVSILLNILNLFRCVAAGANLKNINGGSNVGKITMSKNITNVKDLILINQSVTGLFENRVNLSEL